MKNNITLSLEIPEQAIIIRALINRVTYLFAIRHDMHDKLDKWMAKEIRSTIKLVRLARKAHEIKFSL
jgi:ABC-type enterochelin transport system permease subunit